MLLIKNANLVGMAGIDHEITDILVDGGKFVSIGQLDASSYAADTTVIDAEGQLVTPGLIDGHCHMGVHQDGVKWEGNDTNEFSDPVVPHLRGIDAVKPQDTAFQEALNAGFTTVVTGPGSGEIFAGTFCALKTYGKTVLDMCIKEEVAMKMALGENPKGSFGCNGKAPMTRMASAGLMRENLYKAKAYREKKLAYQKALEEGKEDAKAPEFDMKMESLCRVFDGLPVKIHAHQQDDIVTGLRVMDEFGLKGTIDHCTEGYLIPEVLQERKQPVIIGPLLSSRSKVELRNLSFDSGKVLVDHGIEFSLMTDHPVVPMAHALAQAAILIKHGVPADIILKALTINPAKAAGIADRVGSIEVGKDADLVIWSGDPFHYMSEAECIIVNGKQVK